MTLESTETGQKYTRTARAAPARENKVLLQKQR